MSDRIQKLERALEACEQHVEILQKQRDEISNHSLVIRGDRLEVDLWYL